MPQRWKIRDNLACLPDGAGPLKAAQAPADNRQARTGNRPCGLGRRLLVMLYDTAVIIALLMAATALAMVAGFRELSALRDPLYTLGLAAVWFAYLGWCWHRGGMTLGMRAWRVRIESVEGGRPGWGRCLARFLLSLPSAILGGAGFLWSLVDRQQQCWHDRFSGTRLVRL
jgi:uncharacterized RDD family membrane protein YckC